MSTSSNASSPGRGLIGWFANLSTLFLLIMILVISTGEMMHGQLLKFGEVLFSDPQQQVQYFLLRADPEKPTCNPNINVDEEVARQEAAAAKGTPAGGAIDDVDDLFGARKFNAAAVRESLTATVKNCAERHVMYDHIRQHITPQLKFYRALETSFFTLFKFGACCSR
ncbi:MAG: hypothetical protein HYX44_01330 [Aquabacterium sp.]|nr:hypothetical protein [Aquabacterium sp.]